MGDQHVGLQARLMSHALRKITGVLHKMNATLIFINQIRMKIGVMGYGSPETTTGGNALKFYASVRIDVRRIATLKHNDKSGAWLSYNDKKLGQGRENAKLLLKEDKALAEEIIAKIKEQIGAQDEILPLPDEPESNE